MHLQEHPAKGIGIQNGTGRSTPFLSIPPIPGQQPLARLRLYSPMSQRKLRGRGRLAPACSTGVTYKVQYGLNVAPDDSAPRGKAPLAWVNCSVRLPHSGQ